MSGPQSTVPARQPPLEQSLPQKPSRRELFSGLAALLGVCSAEQRSLAAGQSSPTRFLVNRLTYGWNEQEQAIADQLGYNGYLESQLAHESLDDSVLDDRLINYIYLNWQPVDLLRVNQSSYIVHQLTESTFLRAAFSRRQLYQRMVEFWTDHFNIDINTALNQWLKIVDDRDVIRAHALGTFGDLLLASAKSPSMSMYLNNDISVVGNPNENYARELMELHTMGVDGGYTQQDVVEVARCFTGWAYHGTDMGNDMLKFHYYDSKHDQGPKLVLGHRIPAGGGMNDGLIVLEILRTHPSTAQFIARKLCRYFYSYDPPATLVDGVASTFRTSGGDIRACLRTLFNSVDPANAPAKLKRPYHLIVSAFRASGADIIPATNGWTSALRTQMSLGGQHPFTWMTPDGYPDSLDFWANMLLSRWNFATLLGSATFNGVTLDQSDFYSGTGPTADDLVERLNQRIFGGQIPQNERDQLRGYLLPDPASPQRRLEAIGLAIGSPAFQWY